LEKNGFGVGLMEAATDLERSGIREGFAGGYNGFGKERISLFEANGGDF